MKSRKEMSQQDADRAPITFRDVAAYFSEEEWKLLHEWQKELYKKVMKEIHQALNSLGYQIANPEILLRINKGEDTFIWDGQDSERRANTNESTSSCDPAINPDILLRIKQEAEEDFRVWNGSEETEMNTIPPTGLRSFNTDNYLKNKREAELNLMDPQSSEGEESPSSVVSFTIKEEEDMYFIDQQDSERGERSNSPTGEGSIHRKRKAEEPMKRSITPCKVLSGEVKEKALLTTEKGTNPRSQLLSESNPGRTKIFQYANDVSNPANSSLHPGISKVDMFNKYYQCAGNLKNEELLTCQQSIPESCRPYIYNKYENSFSQEAHLIHPRSYTGERRYQCTECEESFSEKMYLITHQRTHTRERPFQCNDCEKSFSQKVYLITHQRTHTGERPYQCTDCEKSFTQKGTLNTHQRTHTGERPYHCTQCEKSFSQRGALNIHQRTHTGERPFQCTDCERSFSDKRTLIRHQSVHKGECSYQIIKYEDSSSPIEHLITDEEPYIEFKPYPSTEYENIFNPKGALSVTQQRTYTEERPYQCTDYEKSMSEKVRILKHQRTRMREKADTFIEWDGTSVRKENLITELSTQE